MSRISSANPWTENSPFTHRPTPSDWRSVNDVQVDAAPRTSRLLGRAEMAGESDGADRETHPGSMALAAPLVHQDSLGKAIARLGKVVIELEAAFRRGADEESR